MNFSVIYVYLYGIFSDVNKISAGTGEKLSLFFQHMSTFFTGFIIGFVYGWELTLVILSVSPLLAIAAAVITKVLMSISTIFIKHSYIATCLQQHVLAIHIRLNGNIIV